MALVITLFMLTGCGSILDKVTKKQQDATKPAVTNTATKDGDTEANVPEQFTLTELQTYVKDAKNVKLLAQDTGQSLVLDAAKRKELLKFLADSGELKQSTELAPIVANPVFPAYKVQIEGDKTLEFDIYDSLRFGTGSENAGHYYMEKGEIWKSIVKWLPAITYKDSSLGYLFKATKVTINGGSFTEETDVTKAMNPILRTIRGVQLQSSTLPQDAGSPLTFVFTVNSKKYPIEIYSEYLKFQGNTYTYPPGQKVFEDLLASK